MKRLSKKKEDLLREVVAKHCPDLYSENVILSLEGITPDQVDVICQAIANELCETGLDLNDEPNNRGIELEDLIDYFQG